MDIEKIIENSGKMERMLESVYNFNSKFVKNDKDREKLGRIIKTLKKVDRGCFVDNPYLDIALSIGKGQTISQPSTVVRMLFLLDVKKGESVLELGAGSGWNACLLGFLNYPGKVLSLEIIPELVKKARKNKEKSNKNLEKELSNVEFKERNIFSNKIEEKFDKIIITAGITKKQENKIRELEELLKRGGRLICPYQFGPMIIYDKNGELERKETEEEYVFVPLLE